MEPLSAPLLQDLQDKNDLFSHQGQPMNVAPYAPGPYAPGYPAPPPPYTQNNPGPATAPPPAPQHQFTTALYPNQAPVPVMAAPPVQPAVHQIIVSTPQPAPVVVVGTAALPPGFCTVCRKGKMKNSASCCTWLCCCLLLPFGILPGVCVFCCCCREPKCTNCGYTP